MTAMRLLFALSILLLAESSLALRCGNKLVSDGDPMIKVLKYCGEPATVQQRSILRAGLPRRVRPGDTPGLRARDPELLINDRSYVEVLIEEWTYNFGPNKLMRLIRFENGVVADVEQLGYGFNP